ncbi:Poly [ADP-ribose] polymerase 3 [Clonorchis sinensis]|uniref:Poly [ADP-ribose] polymerase n=1 Tax=Clonorchis sinensis TaxID=79923 RepID=A0A8T1MXC1_CLOSI|nr:Poly [ADP-ribose] polymerase 3 [Clonorchis sinensis]
MSSYWFIDQRPFCLRCTYGMPTKRKVTSAAPTSKLPAKQARVDGKKLTRKKRNFSVGKVGVIKNHQVDTHFIAHRTMSCRIHGDYNCTMNRPNVVNNSVNFFLMQLVIVERKPPNYFVWVRWGRMGKVGGSYEVGPFKELRFAVECFEQKFANKTGNKWCERANFKCRPGKYTIIDVTDASEKHIPVTPPDRVSTEMCPPSKLDEMTQELVERIFNPEIFENLMIEYDLDLGKIPLKKLSVDQIKAASEILNELENLDENSRPSDVCRLSSQFHALIPPIFRRGYSHLIADDRTLQRKRELLDILTDIAVAQTIQRKVTLLKNKCLHPTDKKYASLQCTLSYLDTSTSDRQLIEEYFAAVGPRFFEIVHAWRVSRKGEAVKFRPHMKTTNHKLLWYGAIPSAVASILSNGLRVRPHSFGTGIYFKSEAYGFSGREMQDMDGNFWTFLVQVAMGKEYHVHRLNASTPVGFDSVVILGWLRRGMFCIYSIHLFSFGVNCSNSKKAAKISRPSSVVF